MVRLLNKPILEFSIVELGLRGVEEVYLGVRGYVNYRSVYDYFREGFWVRVRYPVVGHDVRIRYMPRYESSGNADAVRVILEYYDIKEDFVVVQGDNVFRFSLEEAYRLHIERKAFMTVVLKPVEDVSGFGVAKLGSDGRIEVFVEKPEPSRAPSNLANTGIYIISPSIREFFNSDIGQKMVLRGEMDFGSHVIPKLIELGYPVYGYVMREGYWFDVGTPDRYLHAMRYLLYHLSPAELEAFERLPGVFMQGKSRESRLLHERIASDIAQKKMIVAGRVLLGRHIKIGEGTILEDSSIDNYTIIGTRCEIRGSAIMDRTYIGDRVRIVNSIIGRHAHVSDNALIVDSVIGDNAFIGEGARLINVKVWPHESVPAGAYLESYEVRPHQPLY